MIKRRVFYIIITVLFLTSMFWVTFSPWSSKGLEKFNNGYGTFDMKSYDPATVYQVLDQMEPKGFTVYQEYFIGDSLFAVFFGIFQIILLNFAYRWSTSGVLQGILIAVPVIRGICDLIENASLYYILRTYPEKHAGLISFSDKITSIKLSFIPLWFLLFLTGIILKLLINHKKKAR